MANEFHTMPLRLEQLFSSRRFRMMSWDEKGAYLLSLAEAWLDGARLRNDFDAIRKMLGIVDDATWSRIKTAVFDQMFQPSEDGKWLVNPHQAAIYEEVKTKCLKLAEGGRKGGLSQAQARLKPGLSLVQAKLKPGSSIQIQNQSQIQRVKEGDFVPEETTPFSLEPEDRAVKSKTFRAPTVEEVASYCRERGNNIDPARFCDHYAAIGWKVGKAAMKDWRAAVRTWEGNDKDKPQSQAKEIRL